MEQRSELLDLIGKEFALSPDGKFLVRVTSKQRPDLVSKPAGYKDNCGYYRVGIGGKKLLRSHITFALAHGHFPTMQVDHINRDRSDDRPENLREVTHAQNMWNRTPKKRTLPMGVIQSGNKFQARVMINRKRHQIGSFATIAEAAAAYKQYRKEKLGEYAY